MAFDIFTNAEPEDYEQLYAKRHNVSVELIKQNARLQLASFLEYQVKLDILSLPDARRRYCKEYPEANRLAVPITRINKKGVRYSDHNYALGSVINMIQPYDDCIREVKAIDN